MKNDHTNRITGFDGVAGLERLLGWSPPPSDPPELVFARQALDGRRLEEAERYLLRALDVAPACAEVRTLLGLLHERLGEYHAAYRCFRLALTLDPHDTVAGDGLHRYCLRFGYDHENQAINPCSNRTT